MKSLFFSLALSLASTSALATGATVESAGQNDLPEVLSNPVIRTQTKNMIGFSEVEAFWNGRYVRVKSSEIAQFGQKLCTEMGLGKVFEIIATDKFTESNYEKIHGYFDSQFNLKTFKGRLYGVSMIFSLSCENNLTSNKAVVESIK